MGLAIAAVVKGYRCIFTTTDKQSKRSTRSGLRRRVSSAPPTSIGGSAVVLGVVAPQAETPNAWKANR
jgi:cystathionine beta-synthase